MTATLSQRLNRLRSFVELDPGNLALCRLAIREAFDLGAWQCVRELLAVALPRHPEASDLIAWSGLAHLEARRYADAEQALSIAIASGVDTAHLRYILAHALHMQKRHAAALDLLTTEVCQAWTPAHGLRGRCLHHLGRRDDAIRECRLLLASVPTDAETNGALALILYESEQPGPAEPHARAALQQDSKQLEALLVSALLESDARRYEAAQSRFDELLHAHADCGRGWLGLAMLELSRLRADAAHHAIERAAQCIPEHVGTWHVLAWIEVIRGNIDAAHAAFERALALNRNFAETHGGLASVAVLRGHDDSARVAIRRAEWLDPQCLSAKYAQMLLAQRLGQPEQARAALDAALARRTESGDQTYRDVIAAHLRHMRE